MTLPLFFETRAHVLVCTGPRCAARGAGALFRAVWDRAEESHLAYYKTGGTVRLTASGCQGACEHGPNAICYFGAPGGGLAEAWYCGLDAERLTALVRALHDRAPLPAEGRYDRSGAPR